MSNNFMSYENANAILSEYASAIKSGGGGGGADVEYLKLAHIILKTDPSFYDESSGVEDHYVLLYESETTHEIYGVWSELEIGSDGKSEILIDGRQSYIFALAFKILNPEEGEEQYTIIYQTIMDIECGGSYHIRLGYDTKSFRGIQQILNAGKELDYLEIGDTIRTTLSSGEVVDFQIAAINQPGDPQHSIIWIAKDTLLTAMTHNNVSDINYTWNTSRIRTYLNGTFYNDLLQSDIKPYVKERTTYAAAHGGASSCTAYRDMVFLPRTYEAIGGNGLAPACEHDSGGATQFPIFTAAANSRIKYRGIDGLTGVKWTLLSPSSTKYSSTTARPWSSEINESGGATGYGNNYAGSEYVVPCWLQVADE